MQNLKIRVNSANESKEVQELFFKLGGSWAGYKKIHDWPEIEQLYLDENYITFSNDINFFVNDPSKEITLPELREMANPMKEYLEKQPDGTYELVLRGDLCKESDILIPEGAECSTKCKDHNGDEWILFWKGDYKFCVGHDKEWFYFESGVSEYLNDWCGLAKVIWQRATHPEELPFIDDEPKYTDDEVKYMDENGQGRLQSISDQYAEIEKVRQAIKVKSGSDSDHALDAMSFGIMGAGAASGGAKMRENSHYFIDVSDVDEVDFYEIAKRYNVTDPAIQHILKKCLAIGNRGHKDLETDLKDILKTAKRALQINGFGE